MSTEYGNSEALEDYSMELGCLDGILDAEVYDAVVVLVDFNADLRKSGRFSKLPMSFLNNSNLILVGLSDPQVASNMSTWHSDDFPRSHGSTMFVFLSLCLIVVHPTLR